MEKKYDEISIVIPIYGDFDIKRAVLCIESIKSQKEVNVEIIVSETGEFRKFPKVEGVKHVFNYHKPREDLSDFNPGKVRNIGIMNSTKEFIYTLDADIIFLDPLFLKKSLRLLKENPSEILFKPNMKRLPRDNFEEFLEWVNLFGFEEAIKGLFTDQEFIVKTTPGYRELKTFGKEIFGEISKEAGYKKTFTLFIEDYKIYKKTTRFIRRLQEKIFNFWPIYWNETRHCGSNFFRRNQFIKVGGYCERFINWGCEDSDLQWKFREKYNLEFFPENLEVVHLDHPRGYISPKMWKENEKKSAERKRDGLEKAIREDLVNLCGQRKINP